MKIVELEVYSEACNLAVVKPPERRLPGVVVQSDSLSILSTEVKELSERPQVAMHSRRRTSLPLIFEIKLTQTDR